MLFYYISSAINDAAITVMILHTTIERLDIAPHSSSIVMALLVPITWLEAPSPSPFAIELLILKILYIGSAMIAPIIPVIIIVTTVIVTIPPDCSEIDIPTAVVMDFGSNVTYISWLNPKSVDIT